MSSYCIFFGRISPLYLYYELTKNPIKESVELNSDMFMGLYLLRKRCNNAAFP